MSIVEHVDGSTKRPRSLHLLILILYSFHKCDFGVFCNLEALCDETMAEGKIQAHEGGLFFIHLQAASHTTSPSIKEIEV